MTTGKDFWVEHTGHRWGRMAAVAFATPDAAIAEATRSCADAMRTTVYDCSKSNVGTKIAEFDRNGRIQGEV